ncbi:MAG: ATP-binding protein [Chryseolinea sp.]
MKFESSVKQKLKFSQLGTWYMLALSAIAIISIVGQVLIQHHLSNQMSDSQVVNIAGRQRMLSQKISKLSLMLHDGQAPSERDSIAKKLQNTFQLWRASQTALQRGNDTLHLPGAPSIRIASLFEGISIPFHEIQKGATDILHQLRSNRLTDMKALSPSITRVLQNEEIFLSGMDVIVSEYAAEANEKINSLRRMEYLLLAISLSVIVAEILFIFRPTAVQVSRTVKKLRTSEKNSKKLLKEIGALYASLEKSYERLSVINQPIENPKLYAKADLGGNVLSLSDNYIEATGFAPSDHQQRLCDLFPGIANPSDWMDEVVDTVTEEKAWQGEIRFYNSDGKECWLMAMIQPVQIENGETELLLIASNMTDRKRAERSMNKKNRAEIEKLVNQQKFRSVLILEGQEEERKRIAMDIHDGIGQMLTSLKYHIESINPDDAASKQKIAEVDQLIKNVIKEIRRVTFNLKPTVLGDYGLQAALNVFITEIAKLTDIRLSFTADGDTGRAPQNIENNVFRIIQEAINNAIKYSGAGQIDIKLKQTETELVITVDDKGKGFDAKLVEARSVNIESGRGFFNMYERTEYVNGTLDIQSSPGKGTTVSLHVPMMATKGVEGVAEEKFIASE